MEHQEDPCCRVEFTKNRFDSLANRSMWSRLFERAIFFFRPKRGHQKKKETRNNNERSQEKRPWYIASVTYTHFIIIGQGFRRLFFFFAGFFFFSFLLAGQTNGRKPQHISHFILSPEIGSEIGVFCLSFLFFTIRNHLTRHATIERREREREKNRDACPSPSDALIGLV